MKKRIKELIKLCFIQWLPNLFIPLKLLHILLHYNHNHQYILLESCMNNLFFLQIKTEEDFVEKVFSISQYFVEHFAVIS